MSKAYKVWEITKQKMNEISRNGESWMDFLRSASYTSKYDFAEQVALYAYRPDARACATMVTWNKVFNHWVNKGAKGIPIPDFTTETPRLKYVFDISDTHPTIYTKRTPEIWEYSEDYEQAYKDIEEMYNINPTLPLEERVLELVDNLVEERLYDYSLEISEVIEGSYIDGIEQSEVNQMSRRLLKNSISYMMMERMNLEPNLYFDSNEFRDITLFSSTGLLSVLGTYSSEIVSNLIDDIRDRKILLDKINLRQNNVNNVLPLDNKLVYNEIKDIKMSTNKILKGGQLCNEGDSNRQEDISIGGGRLYSQDSRDELRTDGRNLFDEGRGSDSQRRDDGKEDGQIRQDEREISEGKQEGLSQQSDIGRDIGKSFIGSTGVSRENAGSNDPSIPKQQEGNRGIESTRSDEVDSRDEQYQELSGGSNQERSNIRIDNEFPTENEQLKIIEEVVDKESATFSISQKNIDDELVRGSGFQDGKYRIYAYFQENNTKKETIEFLKNEYGIGGHSIPNRGDFIDGDFHDAKGLHLSKRGHGSDDIINIDLSWSQVATRIKELIDVDRYLNSKEKEEYQRYLSEESLDDVQVIESQVEGKFYDYKIDNIVYIGTEELRILEFNKDEVILQNVNFPLFVENMEIDEFERKVRENPLNNDSLIEEEPTLDIEINEVIQETDPDENPHNLVTERMAKNVPDILDTSDIDNKDKVVQAIYFVPFRDWTWYLIGLDQDRNLAFGLVAGDEVEWGYFSLDELKEVKAERLLNFTPKTFEEIKDTELKRNLTDLELEMAFNGELQYEEADLEETNITNFSELNTDGIVFLNKEEVVLLTEGNLSEDKISDTGLYLTYDDGKWIGFNYTSKEGFVEDFETIDECISWLNQIEIEMGKEVEVVEKQTQNNFVIKDKDLGVGSLKEKFQKNVDAIRTLKDIESENRMATPKEQEILSKYVGWGGLSSAFEVNSSEYNTLKTLLTDDEFEKARESTLSAFYTPPIVIESMYKALENMGFKEGNLLEPSCGIGNFMGLIPETMKDSKIYGIELDDISGRIAKQLYQENNIAIQGFEETNLPDSFFDVAIGNVPFGQFGVLDKKYEKDNFLIHDYFFAKSLDKVRPGGIIAFITSKGTMDKENEGVRRYIAERADLIGAIRLPNDTFKANAGTEVTSDILFFQKRDCIIDIEPDWIHVGENEDGIRMNSYFIDNPHMVLGKMEMQSGPFGLESTCASIDTPLEDLLDTAINELNAEIVPISLYEIEEEQNTIPADLNTKNYSFTAIDGEIYYRENSIMIKKEYNELDTKRMLGMIEIRELTRSIIEAQLEDYSDDEIGLRQQKLNNVYDKFVEEFGRISDRKNVKLFEEDSSIMLISSLEVLDSERNFKEKAAIFTKRTIGKSIPLIEVETAEEALVVSINEKAKVDLGYMAELAGTSKEEITDELYGVIFKDPESEMYYSSDEYLSGNIREKLGIATKNLNSKLDDVKAIEEQGAFAERLDSLNKEIKRLKVNVDALESVKPKDLDASEISVRLGTTWIPAEDIEKFMFETFETPGYHKWNINVRFSSYTSNWNIEGKSVDRDNIKAITTYGTSRLNAYKILEDTLNLKEVRVFDRTTDSDGKEISVINKKETMLAQQKQDLIKEAFQDWIWKEQERRNRLTKTYNELFNSIRPREYEGSHLSFPGMNPEVSLREHQKNAIAHTLYGGNTLLAHCVGAGKTYEMVASAMESKRLGLCNKSLLVVPNHLTEQIGTEFIELYPSADVLVATKKDFEPKNRKRFCSRIATGDFDAVVIGHSQFEKIPMSIERQRYEIERQIEEITDGIAEIKANQGDRFSIKQLEKTKKNLRVKLGKLNDTSRKDDVVTFEELGIDRLYVDEAHNYKNLYLHTKMRNVAGIGTSEAQKSSDMFMKCRYLDEITEGKGVIFATGTPISNSMTVRP